MAQLHKVIVSVDADEPWVLSDIAAQLTEVGLEVDDVLEAISIITGTIDEEAVSSLETVPGVLDVETQRDYQLPPPPSDVQ